MESTKKRKKRATTLSSFTIILILTFILAIISHILPHAKFIGEEIVDGSGVVGATLSQTLMAPILGFADAIDIGLFILVLGGLFNFALAIKFIFLLSGILLLPIILLFGLK